MFHSANGVLESLFLKLYVILRAILNFEN